MEQNRFYEICYQIIARYAGFPDVAETLNDIRKGAEYQNDYCHDVLQFMRKRDEIIFFIAKARSNNVIDAFKDDRNYLLLIPSPSRKLLSAATNDELFANLSEEIRRLVIKGVHQVIKKQNASIPDNALTAELLTQDPNIFNKYGLIN